MTICKKCNKTACFNTENQKIGIFCKKHKLDGMINVIIKHCIYDNCTKTQIYNFLGQLPQYCFDHKLDNMVNVLIKYCIHNTCINKAIYNYIGLKPKYCIDHKLDNMINVLIKYCNHINCTNNAKYNIKGEKPKYCLIHKLDNMINVYYKKCKFINCNERAHYNIQNKPPKYCGTHKLINMINVSAKKCKHTNCTKTPIYNYIGKSSKYCKNHKLETMINVLLKKCIVNNCNNYPFYNIIGKYPKYCLIHKLDNMIDINNLKCKTLNCNTLICKNLDGYCKSCFVKLFPDKLILINFNIKELTIIKFIIANFTDYNWIYNRSISSKRRPDLLLELNEKIIIIEIDERKHISYTKNYNEKRINDICKDFNSKPIIFIHFNPDNYIENNIRIKSCWTKNIIGDIILDQSMIHNWNLRLNKLKSEIQYWLIPDNNILVPYHIIKLFFNTFQQSNLSNTDHFFPSSLINSSSITSNSLDDIIQQFSDLSDDENYIPSLNNSSYISSYPSDLSSNDSLDDIIQQFSDLSDDENYTPVTSNITRKFSNLSLHFASSSDESNINLINNS